MYSVKFSKAMGGWMVMYRESPTTPAIAVDGPFLTETMAKASKTELSKQGKPT